MLIKEDFFFASLGAVRRLHIRLPDTGEGPFPVMYFFDGQNLFLDSDATYGKSWGLNDYCARWDKPLICVGIECGHNGNERLSEYLPYPSSADLFRESVPLADRTMEGITQELKPWVDQHFPTIPFRECTAIGGSSMGGLMAAYAVVHWNWLFSKAACVSPSLGFVFPSFMTGMRKTSMSPDTRVYLSWGTLEGRGIEDPWVNDVSSPMYRSCHAVAQEVRSRGGTARLYCQIGGHHCEADWEKQAGVFMPFLWQGAE